MNTEKFLAAYRESRNGCDNFVRNPLYPRFLYSDGVQECAEAGCYWLLDILGTELPEHFKRKPDAYMCVVTVTVADSRATIVGMFDDNDPEPFRKKIAGTDMPTGVWTFNVTNEGAEFGYRCILPSEY